MGRLHARFLIHAKGKLGCMLETQACNLPIHRITLEHCGIMPCEPNGGQFMQLRYQINQEGSDIMVLSYNF